MAARKEKNPINLLPRESFAESTLGRVLHWVVSTFRYIVMVTELLVMAAFISRFWLDAKITDLNDSLKQKQAIIASLSNFEDEFKTLQKKLTVFAQTADLQTPQAETLKEIGSYLPTNVHLTNYSFSNKAIVLKGSATDEASVSQFLVNLTKSNHFTKVNLESITSDPQTKSFLIFNLRVVPGKKEV